MKAETIRRINKGQLDADSTLDFVLSHAENVKENILQKWFKRGTSRNDKATNEFLLNPEGKELCEYENLRFLYSL